MVAAEPRHAHDSKGGRTIANMEFTSNTFAARKAIKKTSCAS